MADDIAARTEQVAGAAGMTPEEYGRRILQQLDQNNRDLAALKAREAERVEAEQARIEAERQAKAPEEREKARVDLLTELGRDPLGVLNTVADLGAKKGYELSRRELEQRQAMEQVASYGAQVINANPDLAGYRPMLADTFARVSALNPGASMDYVTRETVNAVRRFKEQSFEEEKRRREREDRARTVGGMPFGGGTFHTNSEGRQMDEKEMAEERYAVIKNYANRAREGRRSRAA